MSLLVFIIIIINIIKLWYCYFIVTSKTTYLVWRQRQWRAVHVGQVTWKKVVTLIPVIYASSFKVPYIKSKCVLA